MSRIACSHCSALLAPEARECGSCGAPVTLEQQRALAERSARRRSRILRWALAAFVLLLAGGAGLWWTLTRKLPDAPVHASQDPAAALIHLEKVFDESRPDAWRRVGVVVENRSENLVNCVHFALRVFDAEGGQLRSSRAVAGRCHREAGALWPKDQVAEVLSTEQLEDGERYDLVIEKLELGAPAAGSPPAKPLAVTVNPHLGVEELTSYLQHQLRGESLERHTHAPTARLEVAFEVASVSDHEVTDLEYALQVLDSAGNSLGEGGATAAGLPNGRTRLPALRPGQKRILYASAYLPKVPPEDFRWQLVVTRFSALRLPP